MNDRQRLYRFLQIVPIVLSLLVSYVLLEQPIEIFASHPSTAHNYFIHSNVYNEWVCTNTGAASISPTTARTRIRQTLRYANPSSDWHALANNRVFFEFSSYSCDSLPSQELAGMRMRVYIRDDQTAYCNNPTVSCIKHYSFVHAHNGYNDYGYQTVNFRTAHINNTSFYYRHTIGHEFGHTLGLADPVDCNSVSIMHSSYYGCTDREWPTTSDRNAVTNLANLYTVPGG